MPSSLSVEHVTFQVSLLLHTKREMSSSSMKEGERESRRVGCSSSGKITSSCSVFSDLQRQVESLFSSQLLHAEQVWRRSRSSSISTRPRVNVAERQHQVGYCGGRVVVGSSSVLLLCSVLCKTNDCTLNFDTRGTAARRTIFGYGCI